MITNNAVPSERDNAIRERSSAAYALALLLLVLCIPQASGQSGPASSSSIPVPVQAVAGAEQKISPTPLSAPEAQTAGQCDTYLPAGLTIPQAAHTTLVSYHVDKMGVQSDVSLYRSSGSSDLDKAALACASASQSSASNDARILVAGEPAEVTLIGGVFWGSPFHSFGAPTPAGEPNLCSNRYPPLAVRLDQEGTAVVDIHIATDGSVERPTVTKSTGHDALDKATLACVVAFRYFPATQNGQPVEIERTLRIDWRLAHAPLGPMVELGVVAGGIVLEGQRYIDADSLKAKLAEIASRNPRPNLCALPMPGPAFEWRSLQAIGHAMALLKAAGVPSVRLCSVPFAGMNK